jgi:hypothetical protein
MLTLDSELRFSAIAHYLTESSEKIDHAMWSDSDQRFVRDSCFDYIGTRIGSTHNHIANASGYYPYETNSSSTAFIDDRWKNFQVYYSAHIFGGTTEEMLKLCETCLKNIALDQVNHIQAKVDDESHLNKYFTQNPPTSLLSRAFLFAEANIYEDVPTNLDMPYSHLQYIQNEIYAIAITVDHKPRGFDE